MARFLILLLYLFSPLVFGWVWSPVSTIVSATPQQSSFATLATITSKSTTTTLSESSTLLTSSRTLSSTSLSTTPSAAQQASHATCLNFTSLQDIYKFRKESNVSYGQIAQCPGTCRRAYGSGNADLAGVGVFASYIILLFFSALFGPILRITAFCCMCEHNCIKQCCDLDPNCDDRRCILGHNMTPRHRDCRHKHNYSRVHNFVQSWNELQGKFLDSQAFFVIPAIVASFVELRKHPPIYEVSFIQALGLALCTSLLVCTLARQDNVKDVGLKQGFYLLFAVAFLLALPYICPKFISPDLRELGDACNRIPKWEKFGFGIYYHFSKYRWKIATLVVLGIAGVIYLTIPVLRLLIRRNLNKGQADPARSKWDHPLRQGHDILGIMVGTGMTIFWAYHLFTIRLAMTKVVGVGDEEKAWNYGQVTAIFTWVPLVLDIVGHARNYNKWIRGDQESNKHTQIKTPPLASATGSPPPRQSTDSHYSTDVPLVIIPPNDPSDPARPPAAAPLLASPFPQLPQLPTHTPFSPDDFPYNNSYRRG